MLYDTESYRSSFYYAYDHLFQKVSCIYVTWLQIILSELTILPCMKVLHGVSTVCIVLCFVVVEPEFFSSLLLQGHGCVSRSAAGPDRDRGEFFL